MGLEINDTPAKARECLSCINVFGKFYSTFREIGLLKDRRIICFDNHVKEIKIYKFIDKKFLLDFEFSIDNEKGPKSFYEVEDNIIIFGGDMELKLIDIRNNKVKILQTIDIHIIKIIMLSNELIALNNIYKIVFYKYDEKNKRLKKIDVLKTAIFSDLFWETKDGNIIIANRNDVVIYNKKSIQTRLKFDKEFGCHYNFYDQYLFVSYPDSKYPASKSFVDIYNIKTFKYLKTFEVEYYLGYIIKLNDNKLILSDAKGNMHELNIDKNFNILKKDIFRAHDNPITRMCKFDDNKILSISSDGNVKLWEFN